MIVDRLVYLLVWGIFVCIYIENNVALCLFFLIAIMHSN